MNLGINVIDKTDQTYVLNLSGELDVYTAPKLKEALLPLTKKKDHLVEVNLAEVDYMDSTGLGIFIHALKNSKEYGSRLKLINPQERVSRLFKITGLDEIIDLHNTVQGGKE